jgi:hypothetical protein
MSHLQIDLPSRTADGPEGKLFQQKFALPPPFFAKSSVFSICTAICTFGICQIDLQQVDLANQFAKSTSCKTPSLI